MVIFENDSSEESSIPRKERGDRRHQIKKSKTELSSKEHSCQYNDRSKLTKEQKAQLQKARNRQAAQRSRDIHKAYVNKLQSEIEQLKAQLQSNRNTCWRCHREIEQQQTQEISIPITVQPQQSLFRLEQREQPYLNHQLALPRFDSVQEQFFLRDDNQEQSNSYMKVLIFVSVALIAAVCIFNQGMVGQKQSDRMLFGITNYHSTLEDTTPIEEIQQKQCRYQEPIPHNALVRLQKPASEGFSPDCLESLMKKQRVEPHERRSLTTYEGSKLPIPIEHEGILLCQASVPKIPTNSSPSTLTKLYLLGSEIKQLLTNSNLLLPLGGLSVQINGLYRLTAQIKEISLVTDHNCLL